MWSDGPQRLNEKEPMRLQFTIRRLFAFVAIAAALVALGLAVQSRTSNGFRVANATGMDVESIVVELFSLDGNLVERRTYPRLASGQSIAIQHKLNDLSWKADFVLNGVTHSVSALYVDLWTGGEWVVTLQPDGSVISEYSPRGE